MNNVNAVAQELSRALGKYGTSELSHSIGLFSSDKNKKADVRGNIGGRPYRVMMYAESTDFTVSGHFTMNIDQERLSDDHMKFWNADNRFTKMYREGVEMYLVMDAFLSRANGNEIMLSYAKIWDVAVKEIARFKIAYDRKTAIPR